MTGSQSMDHRSKADYKPAADLVGQWLLDSARREGEEWSWPAQPSVGPDVNGSLYAGTVGPPLFFLEAYRTDGDKKWLEPAAGAVGWMTRHLEETASGWAGCGLFTGIGGWGTGSE
jgi:hypothetical protein